MPRPLPNADWQQRSRGQTYLDNVKAGFEDDLKIWEHKVYRDQPLLCDGDGPIGKMRRWYRQFYTTGEVHD